MAFFNIENDGFCKSTIPCQNYIDDTIKQAAEDTKKLEDQRLLRNISIESLLILYDQIEQELIKRDKIYSDKTEWTKALDINGRPIYCNDLVILLNTKFKNEKMIVKFDVKELCYYLHFENDIDNTKRRLRLTKTKKLILVDKEKIVNEI